MELLALNVWLAVLYTNRSRCVTLSAALNPGESLRSRGQSQKTETGEELSRFSYLDTGALVCSRGFRRASGVCLLTSSKSDVDGTKTRKGRRRGSDCPGRVAEGERMC